MTLRARLSLSLVLIAAVLVVPLFVARGSIKRLHGDVRGLREGEFQASLILGRLRDALAEVKARELALAVVKTDTVHRQLDSAYMSARTLTDSLSKFQLDASTQRISSALAVLGPAFQLEYNEVLQSTQARNTDSGSRALEHADSISREVVAPALREAERALSPAERELRTRTQERVRGAEEALVSAEQLTLSALAIALLLAAVIALWLTRFINQPVKALEEGMASVADGELNPTLRLDPNRTDEFGKLGRSFLEMTRQLRELDKLKAEFVSIASHELKTPINVILGYIQLMQEGVYGPLSDKQVPVLRTIETQTKTLSRHAGQLLDVSRFEAGGGRIEPRPVLLHHMLDELERTFHVLAVQKNVNFTVSRREGLPEEVVWDPERINEVTGNLLSNAFKFVTSGQDVELTCGPHENGVCIEVCDTGAGIPPENLPKLFRKFYQADNQKQASAKGTGLGLAIAKEIVEAHQGKISVTSTVGEGTQFTIVLPTRVVNRRRTGGFRLVAPEDVRA